MDMCRLFISKKMIRTQTCQKPERILDDDWLIDRLLYRAVFPTFLGLPNPDLTARVSVRPGTPRDTCQLGTLALRKRSQKLDLICSTD